MKSNPMSLPHRACKLCSELNPFVVVFSSAAFYFACPVQAQPYIDIQDMAGRCFVIMDALTAAGIQSERIDSQYRTIIAEAAREGDRVGLQHVVRDLEEQAILYLSSIQRTDLDRLLSLKGWTIDEALAWEAERVQQVVQQGQIKNDDEWRVVERWLQHEDSAHSLEINPTSYGDQVELLETLMLNYVKEHGNPDDRMRASPLILV